MTATALSPSISVGSLAPTRRTFEALPAAPVRARLLDGSVMSLLPRVAGLFGYRFSAGNTPAHRRDAAFVVTTSLSEDGLLPPPTSPGSRRATTTQRLGSSRIAGRCLWARWRS